MGVVVSNVAWHEPAMVVSDSKQSLVHEYIKHISTGKASHGTREKISARNVERKADGIEKET